MPGLSDEGAPAAARHADPRVSGSGLWDSGFWSQVFLKFRVSGLAASVSRFGFRGSGLEFEVRTPGFGSRVSGSGYRVSDLGCRVSGSGFRISGVGFGCRALATKVPPPRRATQMLPGAGRS